MSRITTTSEVSVYPDNGHTQEKVIIKNHWTMRDRVVLVVGGKEYVCIADHLHKAIVNATNAH